MANERRCGKPGAYRFTWPGRDEAYICEEHKPKLERVAEAIGLRLQIIPVGPSDIGPPVADLAAMMGGNVSPIATVEFPICSQIVTMEEGSDEKTD